MDISLAIESLVPAAEYFGSITDNAKYSYEAVEWNDSRKKPTWTELQQAWSSYTSPCPSSVTMRQARLALHAAGLLAGVEAAIEAMEDPPKTEARIEWDFSSEVHRNKPFVAMLTAALGLTGQEVDDLFAMAATL